VVGRLEAIFVSVDFVAVRMGPRADSRGVKASSNRQMLRLEMTSRSSRSRRDLPPCD
jgi:hypothetical protein